MGNGMISVASLIMVMSVKQQNVSSVRLILHFSNNLFGLCQLILQTKRSIMSLMSP